MRSLARTLILLALGAARLDAQETALRLTLDQAVARAEARSHRVGELTARADAAAAALEGSRAAERPLVALTGGYTRTNHVEAFAIALPDQPVRVLYPDVPDNYRARIDLQWPIFTAGRTGALARAAAGERDAATFDVAAARADLRLEATRAFWALVTADQTRDVLGRALENMDAHVRDLRVRLDQGLIPPNEVLTAEAQRSRQRLLAIDAANLRAIAEADLRRVIGEDQPTRIEAVVAADAASRRLDADADRLLAEGRKNRPERQALASRAAASREREAAAEAAARPQLAVGAGYDYARPNPRIFPRLGEWRDSWDVSINGSWTLWDGGRSRAEQAGAAAATRAVVARAAEFDRQLAFEIEQRRLEVDSTAAAIETAEDGVRAAVEARRVVGERFTAGVASSTEVLDAQMAVLEAELDRTRAVASARLAVARLERAVGRQ